jgi:hypothetical protein
MQLDDPWAAADAASAGGAQSVQKFMRVSMQDGVHRQPLPPSIRGARFDAREQEQRRRSAERLRDDREAEAAAGPFIPDVLMPDVFSEIDDADEWLQRSDGVSSLYISDENGALVDWPWETKPASCTGGRRRRHRLDDVILKGLMHSMASGDMGANSTGVRRWKKYCATVGISPHRVLDPSAPLHAKLREEWTAMRFVAWLVEDEQLAPRSAATYFGQVQGWHAKEHGVKLAAGIKLNRLPAMLKGLRRVYTDGGRRVRRGVTPQGLRAALDKCYPRNGSVQNANIRAALTLAFQGLLRGAEFAADGAFKPTADMTRADVVSITAARLVVMMRPCKNMQFLSGKTVPLIIGGGGSYVDAVEEMIHLMEVDPVEGGVAAKTPLFRMGSPGEERTPLTTRHVLNITKQLMRALGEDPTQFGSHSYRIGGATALFAAGADPTVIRTMGRWSSDCYRLYVRACFGQTLAWSTRCGSVEVSDVAAEFEEVDSY